MGSRSVRDAGSTEAPNTDNSLPQEDTRSPPPPHLVLTTHHRHICLSFILAWTCHCQLQSPHSSDGCSLRPQFLPPPPCQQLLQAPVLPWISATVQRTPPPLSSLQALAQTGSSQTAVLSKFCCHNPCLLSRCGSRVNPTRPHLSSLSRGISDGSWLAVTGLPFLAPGP